MSRKEFTCGDYTYILLEDGKAKITGLLRNAKVREQEMVCVPDQLDGHSVVELGGVFRETKTLREVRLPDSLEVISYGAFYRCTALGEIQFPKRLKRIGDWAFDHCAGLKTAALPDGVEVIGQYAFYKCALERLILPPSVREIGRNAFWGCDQAIFEALPGSYAEAWLAARQNEPDAYPDDIFQSYEVRFVYDMEFFVEVLRPLLSIYRTSEFLTKMLEMHRKNPDVVSGGYGTIVYRDSFILQYLRDDQYKIAFEAFMRGKKAGSPLMDCSCQVIDNEIANSFGIIETNCVSRYRRLSKCMHMQSKGLCRSLLNQLVELANKGVFVPLDAIWFNERDGRFLILDYSEVKLDVFDAEKELKSYLSAYRKRLLGTDDAEADFRADEG